MTPTDRAKLVVERLVDRGILRDRALLDQALAAMEIRDAIEEAEREAFDAAREQAARDWSSR